MARSSEKNSCEKQPCRHWGQWRMERRCCRHQSWDSLATFGGDCGGASVSLQLLEKPCWSRYPHWISTGPNWRMWIWSEGTVVCERCTQEQVTPQGPQSIGRTHTGARKRVRKKVRQRGTVLDWQHHPSIPHCHYATCGQWGVRGVGKWRSEAESWQKRLRGKGFFNFVFFSWDPNLF